MTLSDIVSALTPKLKWLNTSLNVPLQFFCLINARKEYIDWLLNFV